MPLLSYNNKDLFFIHIPKTGGSSIYSNLSKQGVNISYVDYAGSQHLNPQHFTFKMCKKQIPNFLEYKKFTILRDPEKRILSEFHWRTKAITYQDIDEWIYYALNAYGNDNEIYDNHIRPQSDFISRKTTKIFLHDNYSDATDYINQHFEYSFDYRARKKRSKIKFKPKLRQLVSNETYIKFKEIYEKDIDLYKRVKKDHA